MKAFQMRLADEVYGEIKNIADLQSTTIAGVIRTALENYVTGTLYAREGKRLFWEDPSTGEKVEVVLPGFTRRQLRQRMNPVELR